MVLLGDEAQVEAHFDPFGGNTNFDSRLVHGLHQMYHSLINYFGHTQWYSKVTRFKWNLVFVRLETVLILTLHRCIVYAKLP
jgi:hypothetical protein